MARRLTPNERHAIAIFILLIIIATLIARLYDRRRGERLTDRLEVEYNTRADSTQLTRATFDPNTVELPELLRMGLTKQEALSILRYRAAGRTFRIKEDLIGCWGIGDSLYYALEPYIIIGEEYRYKQRSSSNDDETKIEIKRQAIKPFTLDTVQAAYLQKHGLLSLRQAEVMLRWHATTHISCVEELRKCYVVSDSAAEELARHIIFTPKPTPEPTPKAQRDSATIVANGSTTPQLININTADSTTLRRIRGVGERSVMAIIERRSELGGFHSVEQLREVETVLKSNFEKIISQIFIDSCDISKIDINFAPATELSAHPYFNKKQVRRILHLRQLKGGWSNIEIMIEDKIFTQEEALKVRPYLDFVLPN